MREHVCVRCGAHTLLFPAENVGFIEPVASTTSFERSRRRDEPLLDLRRLLGVDGPRPAGGVLVEWRSTDGLRRATLLLDAVEAIVDCQPGDRIAAPLLPLRLRPLCEQVMRDPRGTLRLLVKTDVELPLRRRDDRRRFVRSCVRAAS